MQKAKHSVQVRSTSAHVSDLPAMVELMLCINPVPPSERIAG